ncbi:DUF1501 domain-containing protein [Sphingomonas sp. ASV193]|uniref:DUF1501 domain-containing protein n=1 Tax=Sphingomonas sp. ASV193 TaxID=3144405 RepID=UPI0032E85962
MFDRRQFIQLGGAAGALLGLPRIALAGRAAGGQKRLLFIIQRGAADGLAIVAPTGDPAYVGLRGDLAADVSHGTKLDSMFSLHPAMARTAQLFQARQALFVHAVASPYRDRSHFDGQNVLETGASGPYRVKDGWMNRLLAELPGDKAVALAPSVPMALRGANAVSSYAPSNLPDAPDDLMLRIGDLYAADKQLGPLWSEAQSARKMAGDVTSADSGKAAGDLAARMMAGPAGARVAMIETNGWDTHNGQNGRLANQLKGLDAMVGAFRDGMGADWNNSLVLVATEFGRTAHANGTGGTDHGTGSMAMLLGGGLQGGRVLADWPGLSNGALYQARDLKPTTDLDALIATALSQHFALDPARTSGLLFPETRPAALRQTLVA